MKVYQSYRDSKLEWIGEIPKQWESIRLKYIGLLFGGLSGKSGKDFNNDENESNKPFIPFTNICNNTYISKDDLGKVNILDNDKQNKVERYDLFFLMSSEDFEGIGNTSVLRDELGEVYLNTFCRGFRITDREFSSFFVNYLFKGHSYSELLSIEGRGFTRINLRSHKINDFKIFYPPHQEQKQIVTFLDSKSQKIDKLIELNEQKIELLKVQRTALINQCVTKGLNPNVEMKDSGVEWIGEIPKHWSVGKLGYYSGVSRGSGYQFLTEVDEEYTDLKEKVVRISDFSEFHPIWCKYNERFKNYKIGEDNILVGGTGHYFGRSIFVDDRHVNLIHSYNILRLVIHNQFPKYIFYYLNTSIIREQMDISVLGSGQPFIDIDGLKSLILILPAQVEQVQIVEYLDEQTQKIDSTIGIESQRIERLKEYRQALISEVVTGKIDVRDWDG